MLDPSATTPQGRPRDPDVDRRIELAAQSLLAEGGYAALTVEAVAQRAGVARTTVYRRHPSRLALAFASLLHPPRLGPPPDTGGTS